LNVSIKQKLWPADHSFEFGYSPSTLSTIPLQVGNMARFPSESQLFVNCNPPNQYLYLLSVCFLCSHIGHQM